ncbi:MAG: peroxiredoxin family protein [Gammaproteobacteria bacterium]
MKRLSRALVAVLLIGLFGVSAWLYPKLSKVPAPNVTFTTITGEKIELQTLRGKPVLVTFWATDCRSCIEEMPDLLELYRRFHPLGLEIIAVAMYYDPPNHVVTMTRAKQLPYPVALDLRAEHAKAFGDVSLTPNHFVIDPNGRIVMRKLGKFDPAVFDELVEALLMQGNS